MKKQKKCSQCANATLIFRAELLDMDTVVCEKQSTSCGFEDPACEEFSDRDE